MAAGVAVFVASVSTYGTLEATRSRFYRDARFADVFVTLKRGIGAAQKGAGSNKRTDHRNWVVSFVVGILLALVIAVGAFILLVSQQ